MGNSTGSVAASPYPFIKPSTSPPGQKFSEQEQTRIEQLKTHGDFNIDCLVFEGGGAKAAAYVGAVQVLEELGVLSQVHRFAGTSGGALVAMLLAIRLPLPEIRMILDNQEEDWIKDARYGLLSLVPNLVWNFGWNSSSKLETIFRAIINRRFTSEVEAKENVEGAGEACVTFMDIYKKFGAELCVVSTNISTKSAQYHHPKTTPNQSVVEAVMASIAIPVFCRPVEFRSQYLVDGGILVNFPLHAFDGWFLSMKPHDSFFHKSMDSRTAFSEYNEKTVGFILTSMGEKCAISDVVEASEEPDLDRPKVQFPDTGLRRLREDKIQQNIDTQQNEARLASAAEHFLDIFKHAKVSEDRKISRKDFEVAYNNNPLSKEDEELLFGEGQTVQTIFKELDKTPDNELTFSEFLCAMHERGVIFRSKLLTYLPSDVSSITTVSQFLSAVFETLHGFTSSAHFIARDVERTVNIETWYVQTLDLHLEPGDRDFLVQRGVNACLDYMEKRTKASRSPCQPQ